VYNQSSCISKGQKATWFVVSCHSSCYSLLTKLVVVLVHFLVQSSHRAPTSVFAIFSTDTHHERSFHKYGLDFNNMPSTRKMTLKTTEATLTSTSTSPTGKTTKSTSPGATSTKTTTMRKTSSRRATRSSSARAAPNALPTPDSRRSSLALGQ